MSDLNLKGINISPAEFLSAFFQPHETVCLRVLPDKKGSAFSSQNLDSKQGHLEKILPILQEHNTQKRGIFFVVNFGGHDGKNITRVNAQFVDIDHGTLEEQLERVKRFQIEPSLIVKTKRGFHCYWLMKSANVEHFSHIQKRLVKQFDGDPQCVDLPRVLRVPGFYHHKEEPFFIECIKFNPELRYTQELLSEVLPQIVEEELTETKSTEMKMRGTQKA